MSISSQPASRRFTPPDSAGSHHASYPATRPELYGPVVQREEGALDIAAIEAIVKVQNSSSISEQALLVRNIIANLLLTDAGTTPAVYNIFLPGGNFLLLGNMCSFYEQVDGGERPCGGRLHELESVASLVQAGIEGEADGHDAAGHEGLLRRFWAGWDRLPLDARIGLR